ncbi:MAG TPA: hypothetical protein VEA79_05445, partial [Phenylobacterium sp.]|nr:hypothetical protein [Phenylobacterium sp.]
TKGFLDYFGLKRLEDLPPLSELKDIGDLEPQLAFDAQVATGDAPGGAVTGDNDNEGGSDEAAAPPRETHDDDAELASSEQQDE